MKTGTSIKQIPTTKADLAVLWAQGEELTEENTFQDCYDETQYRLLETLSEWPLDSDMEELDALFLEGGSGLIISGNAPNIRVYVKDPESYLNY